MGQTEGEATKKLPDRDLFELKRLVSVSSIRLSARCEVGRRQLLAFVMGSGDLCLHYMSEEKACKPVMRHIPWYADSCLAIAAMCFDPSGSWLLLAGFDATLFIVPALALVDGAEANDHRWSTTDITVLPPPAPPPTTSSGSSTNSDVPHQLAHARPTALVWWQSLMDCHHTAIIATEAGTVMFISLAKGTLVGTTYVRNSITSLHMCQDNSLDTVFLLITCTNRSQWKLLLEERKIGYSWPLDVGVSCSKPSNSGHPPLLSLGEPDTGLRNLPRSRLQGLKQMSVEKLASIRLKLAETRSRGIAVVQQARRESNSSSSDEAATSQNRKPLTVSSAAIDSFYSVATTGPMPVPLSAQVGETFLCPQYARGRYLLSGYYAPSSILTIHGMDLEVVPLFVHKLPPDCGDLIVTDRFLFLADRRGQELFVISTQLSESRLDGDTDYNSDSVINSFTFAEDEQILGLYKHSSPYQRKDETNKQGHSGRTESRRREKHRSDIKELEMYTTEFTLPVNVSDLKIDAPRVDTVIVVTNRGLYEVKLRRAAIEIFMDLVLEYREVERAERLALVFGLNLQQLLEMAGDLKLAAKDYPQAIALYKLSRCRHLKSVLKFAAAGLSIELLGYINLLLETTGVDLTVPERIHLANLAVMAHSEQVLRAVVGKASLLRKYLKFLQDNPYYDEVLAVNVAGQTGLWDVLEFLCNQRGLHFEVLDVLCKTVRTQESSKSDISSAAVGAGLWRCLSDPSLQQALISRPVQANYHLQFVTTHLPSLETPILERFAALFDPSSPVLRPAMHRVLASGRERMSISSSCSGQEIYDIGDSCDEQRIPVEKMITTFLLVLLYLAKQRSPGYMYSPELMGKVALSKKCHSQNEADGAHIIASKSKLSSGFAHVAVVRNTTVYTWGNAAQGCLGTGPTMSRFGTPHGLSLFPNLKVEVTAVACGRQHTLALTTNGVYSWGSSQFGQLGIGMTGQSPTPILVRHLAAEIVIAISAGQYHSLALTRDGRVYSWGWGVHGQLGLGSVEDAQNPVPVKHLSGKNVTQVCGGHGHSLFLTDEGKVYTCGSSVFGQLGNGGNVKSSVPVLVSALQEPCSLVSTGYFHNLALSTTNKLYSWGSSPQVLRLQAQAHKKARLMQQQSPPTPDKILPPPLSPPAAVVVSPTMEFKGLASIGSEISLDSNTILGDTTGEKEGQHHLFPQEVDTSLVDGSIVQLSCGCHHSALLTSDGTLYVWGRNLDGQLGSGSRKEVLIPTPVVAPKKSPTQSAVCGGIPEDSCLQEVSCGCEFTAALETSSGRLWAWGSNAHGQLGKPPVEEGKALEGRLVMLKTSKRVIKLPHGAHNAFDLPQEVLGIPSNTISFQGQTTLSLYKESCPPLREKEDPPYGLRIFHFALQHFFGHYDLTVLLNKCLELGNYQAASRLAALDRHYHVALSYQLQAFTLASSAISREDSLTKGEEKGEVVSENNSDDVTFTGGEGCLKSVTSESDDMKSYIGDQEMEAMAEVNGTVEHIGCNEVESAKENVNEIKLHSVLNCETNETTDKEIRKSLGKMELKSEKKLIDNILKEESDNLAHPTGTVNCKDGVTVVVETSVEETDVRQSTSISSTPESLVPSEIHPFAIQGGKEQMFEETRYLTSPESPSSLPGLQTPDLTSSLGSEDIVPTNISAPDVLVSSANPKYTKVNDTCCISDQESGSHSVNTNDTVIDVSNNIKTEANTQEVVQDLVNEDSILKEPFTQSNIYSSSSWTTSHLATRKHVDGCEKMATNDVISQVATIVEYHMSLMEEDSHSLMSHLLQQGIEFWLRNSLPIDRLECLLLKHMSKLFYPLGLHLLCKENTIPVLDHLSPQFCLELCSTLLANIEQTKKIPTEYVEVLSQIVNTSQRKGCNQSEDVMKTEAPNQLLETVLSDIVNGGLSSITVHPTSELLGNETGHLLVFTCGHQCPETRINIQHCAATTQVLQQLYEKVSPPLACPNCVLGYLQTQLPAEV